MERTKMKPSERAKQFMPFDALKGLREALKLKEFEHEKVTLGELSEDEAQKISNTLSSLQKNDIALAQYYNNSHIFTAEGKVVLKIEEGKIYIGGKEIEINSLVFIEKKN